MSFHQKPVAAFGKGRPQKHVCQLGLKCRVKVSLRLLDRDQVILQGKGGHQDREHLADAGADIPRADRRTGTRVDQTEFLTLVAPCSDHLLDPTPGQLLNVGMPVDQVLDVGIDIGIHARNCVVFGERSDQIMKCLVNLAGELPRQILSRHQLSYLESVRGLQQMVAGKPFVHPRACIRIGADQIPGGRSGESGWIVLR